MFRQGDKIGLYRLIRKLGKGGFGEVWLAERTSKGFSAFTKKVAVKLPHDEQINFKAIEQEATLWEEASGHANVLPIIDADIYNGQVIIVSEYADGGSLAERLEREGKFPVKKAVETAIGILSGLEYLHSKKIIHRDIKPQNILLQGETPRLADFGISRAMNTTTFSSQIVGTDAYMSPEALDGKRTVQTDVWSVGVVLYELLKDDLPFPQEHPSERMFAILLKEFEPLSLDIPYKLRDVVKKALAKKPEERYVSAAAMRQDLTAILSEMSHRNYAATEAFPREEIAEAKRLTGTDEQNLQPETAEPRKLKELDELGQTPAAATQSSQATEPVKFISNPIPNPPPTKVHQFANTSGTAKKKTTRFLYIGTTILASLIFISAFSGYLLLSSKDELAMNTRSSNSNVSTNQLSLNATTTPAVLVSRNIRIGDDLSGWVSSDNKMTVNFEIKGIGSPDVMEQVRKDLFVEINGQEATIVDSKVVNGTYLVVRAVITLPTEIARNFNSDRQQDFSMRVEMSYSEDIAAKSVNTKFQKGKGNDMPSLGILVSFGDVEEETVAPKTTPKPVVSNPTPIPNQRQNEPQKRDNDRQQTQTQTTTTNQGSVNNTAQNNQRANSNFIFRPVRKPTPKRIRPRAVGNYNSY